MAIPDLLNIGTGGAGALSTGVKNKTRSNYIALAIVNKGEIPEIGDTYITEDSSNVVVSGSTLAIVAKDLFLRNKARWLPNGTVNGAKDETINMMQGVRYGKDPFDTPTGEITDLAHFTFKNYRQNIAGLNYIRANPTLWDYMLFTETDVTIVKRDLNSAIIAKVAGIIAGSQDTTINGVIDIGWIGEDGEVVPEPGVYIADLGAKEFGLHRDTLVNLTAGTCNGDYERLTRTTPTTISTVAFLVDEASVGCRTFSLYRLISGVFQPATGSTYASINSTTGLVTFPAAHVTGATKYMVVLANEVGCYASYKLEVNI